MKKGYIGIIAWALVALLSFILLFFIPKEINATVVITCIFEAVAFIGVLILGIYTWNNPKDANEQFLRIPSIIIGIVYSIIQIPVGIIFAIISSSVSYRISLVVNIIILVVAWLLIIDSVAGNGHIRKVESRQKDHHAEL